MTWPSRHVSIPIPRSPEAVVAVAGDPAALPSWAAGLAGGIRRHGDRWIADAPFGTVEVSFIGPVQAGVLDHDVTMPDGEVVHNPLRVLRNDDGSEVVFTVYQRPGMTDEQFEQDAAAVAADLERLRALLER